jgi:hypothetical protein
MVVDNFEGISSRLAIQLCVGYSENGRARHRTINIKNIDPNADISMLAAFVRDTIAPLLAYPITRARLVTKKVRVLFDADHKKAEPCEPEPVVTPAAQGERAASEAAIHKESVPSSGKFSAFARLLHGALGVLLPVPRAAPYPIVRAVLIE